MRKASDLRSTYQLHARIHARGRPPKGAAKYTPVSIRLDPRVIAWAKKEAKKRGLGYQTVINEVLLRASA
jgi:uncharacterized protein (DUF4415 family)